MHFTTQFLDDCTAKLKLESGARRLFDWEGNEMKSFAEGMTMTK